MNIETCKKEIEENGVPSSTAEFFEWAFRGLINIDNKDITAKSFAFRLMDSVAEVPNSEAIFKSIIEGARRIEIRPWVNVVGPRLQASSCLANFLELKLARLARK